MKKLKLLIFAFLCSAGFSLSAQAQDSGEALSGFQLGAAFDLGFGATMKMDRFAFFVGEDGGAVDYRVLLRPIKADIPMAFYVDVGGFFDWNGNAGARAPVGMEFVVAKGWTIYAQLVPAFTVVDYTDFDVDFAAGFRYQF